MKGELLRLVDLAVQNQPLTDPAETRRAAALALYLVVDSRAASFRSRGQGLRRMTPALASKALQRRDKFNEDMLALFARLQYCQSLVELAVGVPWLARLVQFLPDETPPTFKQTPVPCTHPHRSS
jgi:hypothetical protein